MAPAPAPAAEPVYEAAPVAAPIEPAPVAPAPVEAAPAPVAAAPIIPAAEPAPFEAPSGPLQTNAAPEAAPANDAPKKKGKGGLIAILVAVGVVMLALIGVGVVAVINGGFSFGGTIIERIEKMDKVDSGKKYTVYDEDFNDYIVEARWWNYDGTMDKAGVYSTDTETIGFSIEVNEDAEDEIYYAYYYSKDKEFDKEDLKDPIYSTTIGPEEYSNGTAFYNIDCSKKIKKGYYVVVVASDSSLKHPYILAYAEVK